MKYQYLGTAPTTLSTGQPVGYGDVANLSKAEAAENASLIDAGVLVTPSESDESSKQSSTENNTASNTSEEGS